MWRHGRLAWTRLFLPHPLPLIPIPPLARLLQAGVPRSKLVVIPESVDCALFDPQRYSRSECRQAHGPDSDSPAFAFLSVGKWEERKGFEELVSAFVAEFGFADEDSHVRLYLRTRTPQTEAAIRQRVVELVRKVRLLAGSPDGRNALRSTYPPSERDVVLVRDLRDSQRETGFVLIRAQRRMQRRGWARGVPQRWRRCYGASCCLTASHTKTTRACSLPPTRSCWPLTGKVRICGSASGPVGPLHRALQLSSPAPQSHSSAVDGPISSCGVRAFSTPRACRVGAAAARGAGHGNACDRPSVERSDGVFDRGELASRARGASGACVRARAAAAKLTRPHAHPATASGASGS